MKPCDRERRVVAVPAGIAWEATLKHRVYSCPDTPDFDFVYGATCLLLKQGNAGARVILNVKAVETCNPHGPHFLDAVPGAFRSQLSNYREAVHGLPIIFDWVGNYRFYFLSGEPWPTWLQILTQPEQCPNTAWAAVHAVWLEAERFFEWPQVGALLWPGCTRTDGGYIYPPDLLRKLALLDLPPGQWSNDPAILAFLAAGGTRPRWANEGWPIHHIYDGTEGVPHAVHDGKLFTHSAGLVAAHPVAHHLAHQSELLKWLLRREAFLRFGFDPMNVFGAA